MTRTILPALLFALAAPLCAGGLVQKVFEQKIADDWYAHFQRWAVANLDGDKFIDTHFVVEDKSVPHRINSIEDGRLFARQLRVEGDLRSEVGEPVRFEWKQWLPKYISGAYPVATNEDDQDVVAFAIWLYLNAEDALLGNRILTVLYERTETLREDICDYVRDRHGYRSKDRLEVTEYWDTDFAKWRRVLLSDKDANAREKVREKAEGAITELLAEYFNREKRTLTLDQIEYAIKQWLEKFDESRTHRKEESRITKALQGVAKDREKIKVHLDLATPREAEDVEWDKTAEDYEKALELDPCSPLLLSKAANAWMTHGKPLFRKNDWECTHEGSIRKAKDLYYRWLDREPTSRKVMEQLVTCHHILGEDRKAQEMQKRIEALN